MKSYSKYFSAFTLAEMMVVLLIMSIVLACMAPVMTTKMKADQSIQTSPWRWADNNTDAYFSAGSNQFAMIGQNERAEGDNSKLIINNSTNLDDMISFKSGANTLGHLRISANSVLLGTLNSESEQGAVNLNSGIAVWNDGVAVGRSTRAGERGVSFGIGTHSGRGAVALGDSSTAGESGIALGYEANADVNSIAIGSSTKTFAQSITIGNNIDNSSENSVSIGHGSSVTDVGGTAVGDRARASTAGTSLGSNATAVGDYSVAIGSNATAGTETTTLSYGNAVAIGNNASATESGSIAIGSNAVAANSTVAIGYQAGKANTTGYGNTVVGMQAAYANTSGHYNTIMGYRSGYNHTSGYYNTLIGAFSSANTGNSNTIIGYDAGNSNLGNNNVALGKQACYYVKGSNKTCIGTSSGPTSGHAWANDDVERIFIGSKSAFNGGPAALEVHNNIPGQYKISSSRGLANTVVVVNGALLVKGGIITSMPWVDDRNFASDGGVNLIGRTGGQLEPVNVDWNGNADQVSGEYGNTDRGTFKSPNSHNVYGFSDRRLKYVGTENHDGLAKLRQIKVFNYTFKKDDKKTPRVGVIAQDLQKIFPNAVKKGTDGFLTIRMEDMFYAVINAIKELDARITALENENKLLKEQNKALDARLKALEAKIK